MKINKFEDDIRNLKGTMAVEGMTVSKNIISDLKRISKGETTYIKLVKEIKEKYTQRA